MAPTSKRLRKLLKGGLQDVAVTRNPVACTRARMTLVAKPRRVRCKARTQEGTPCRAWAVEGETRCRHHRGRCRALTKSGKPCRGGGLNGTGRCKWHGGSSSGPRTPGGKARVALNLPRVRLRHQSPC